MTSITRPGIGAHVQFRENEHIPGCGTITRLWDKPAADPYVTIKTCDDGRTFVRCTSAVTPADSAPVTRLNAIDRAVIRRVRELTDSIRNNREREWSGHDDQTAAYAACLGAAGWQLDELLSIITRLDGTP